MKIAILDNLRSVYNVGSIFRTANAVGIEKIYLCGTTPTPVDTKGERRKDFAKVALGAEESVLWEYRPETRSAIEELKREGFYMLALEQEENSVDYKEIDISKKENVAFIIGHEVDGITKDVLELADQTVEIPMVGTKESLNVTIAFGVAAYRILGV